MTTPDRAPEPVDLDALAHYLTRVVQGRTGEDDRTQHNLVAHARRLIAEVKRLRADIHRFEHSEALQVVELESELARTRPVVEAAVAWRQAELRAADSAADLSDDSEFERLWGVMKVQEFTLRSAVDEYTGDTYRTGGGE